MMLRYALLDIMRDRARFALTVLGIAIGVAQFVALFSFSAGLEREFSRTMSGLFDRLIATPRYASGRLIGEDAADSIEAMPEVTRVVRKRSTVGRVSVGGGRAAALTVAFVDVGRMKGEVAVERGSASDALLGPKALERLRQDDPSVDVGSELAVSLPNLGGREVRARVGGVLAKEGLALGTLTFDHAVVLPLEELPEPGYDLALVSVDRLEHMAPVGERIERELALDVVSFEAAVREVMTLTDGFNYAFFLISLIAILIASMATMNTMMITVIERTREIGMLKALGVTRLEVVAIFLAESLAIGVVGSAIGCVLGVALSRSLVAALIRRTGLAVVPLIDARILLASLAIGTLIAGVSGALPARRAGEMDPLEALAQG